MFKTGEVVKFVTFPDLRDGELYVADAYQVQGTNYYSLNYVDGREFEMDEDEEEIYENGGDVFPFSHVSEGEIESLNRSI